MELVLTDEQKMLDQSARDFIKKASPVTRMRESGTIRSRLDTTRRF